MPHPDPALAQLHLFVCIMIELARYAETDKVLTVFELCKRSLKEYVLNFPLARDVVSLYLAVPSPHKMPSKLMQTKYTDEYVTDVIGILEEIFTHDDGLEHAFKALTGITN